MIRDARAADAPEVAALWNRMITETTHTFTTQTKSTALITQMITEQPFFVATKADKVVGFVSIGPFRAGPGYAHTVEHTVLVAQAEHGTGVGRALMTRAVARARDDGRHVMIAGISATNPGAIAFHAAIGFIEVARMRQVGRKWEQWLDLVLMQKML